MKTGNTPYRHEIRSKLKTQTVSDKNKYNRDISKEELRDMLDDAKMGALIGMVEDSEELGLYEESFELDEHLLLCKQVRQELSSKRELDIQAQAVRDQEIEREGSTEGQNFLRTQEQYTG